MTPRLLAEGLRGRVGPFDLSLDRGECLAVSGASGAGKSLMLRLLADLDPGEGRVVLDGEDRTRVAAPAWRRQVAYLAAESGWWAETVAAHFADLPAARALAPLLLLDPGLLDGPVLRLSTGERHRLGLLRTLVRAPKVLLLDEPTGPLDPEATRAVEAVLRERLETGVAAIVVTHDPDQADRLGARRAVMAGGRLG